MAQIWRINDNKIHSVRFVVLTVVTEDCCLLGCDALYSGRYLRIILRAPYPFTVHPVPIGSLRVPAPVIPLPLFVPFSPR
jgi:hypothetical protein